LQWKNFENLSPKHIKDIDKDIVACWMQQSKRREMSGGYHMDRWMADRPSVNR